MKKLFAIGLSFFVFTDASADELPTARAENVGMSTERLGRVSEVGERIVASGEIPGLVTLVARNGKIVHFEAVGQRGVDDNRPLQKDDLFRLFSMTKPVVAVALMQLYEQGGFQLSDPVSKFVPELANLKVLKNGRLVQAKRAMTMHHLLSHTAGLSHGIDASDPVDQEYAKAKLWQSDDLDDFAARLGKLPLKYEPGTQWHYSVAMDVVGLIVQRLSGETLDVYLTNHLFQPLGMPDTFFAVPADKFERLLPIHFVDSADGKLKTIDFEKGVGEIPGGIFDDCRAMCDYQDVTLFAGSGGLVSTAHDYARFAEMLRNGGQLDDVQILSPKTIKYMTTNHLPALLDHRPSNGTIGETGLPSWLGFGLGLGVILDPPSSGFVGSTGEYFWNGGSGVAFWVDPVEDLVVIGLSQRVGEWPIFHPGLKVATYQAITESKSNKQ